MNIFITGKRNCGKTTLLESVLDKLNKAYSGFESRPYYENEATKGYCFHSFVDVSKNDTIFSKGRNGNTEVFEILGVECLENSLSDDSKIIIMDEIGRFESNAVKFLSILEKCLDSEKNILGILKKEYLPHIEKIKGRNDVYIFDMDNEDKDKIYNSIVKLMGKER